MRFLATFFTLSALALTACSGETTATDDTTMMDQEPTQMADETTPQASDSAIGGAASNPTLTAVLDSQPDEVKARYAARHPQATLSFFGIEPGMTVVEALPGGGWYSKILMGYLGADGRLTGANYAIDLWPLFGSYSAERVKKLETWPTDWPETAASWGNADAASVDAFMFGNVPETKLGTADAVLFVRALHNLARFESEGGFLTEAVANAYDVLKPGGVLGVVQHSAPDTASDEWASGSRGYLKEAFVVATMEAAGFELVGGSDINANPADQPGADDIVWRLPPSLSGSKENPEQAAAMQAIGESNRMTLKFVKPMS